MLELQARAFGAGGEPCSCWVLLRGASSCVQERFHNRSCCVKEEGDKDVHVCRARQGCKADVCGEVGHASSMDVSEGIQQILLRHLNSE
jgi:hypothetical protein